MNRLKYLALAALVAFAACDEGDDDDGFRPMPTISGTITGTVTAEGAGVPGITVTLTGPSSQSATTGANGSFTFNNVEGGAYAVSISNIPADFVFSTTSQAVTITQDGQTASVSFSGQIVRTGSISGQVTASGTAVEGVAVTISGAEGDQTKQTGASGNYSFTGLRSGSYTVSITNPNEDVFTFNVTEQDVTLNAGESEVVNFAGTREGSGGGGTGEEASVVIQGITGFAGTSVPVNALAGIIVARAGVDEGDQNVTKVEFNIGDETVCTQTFSGAAAVDGQQSGDNFVVDCTINTAQIVDGEPRFLNGATTLVVTITTASGDTETATINIGLANPDVILVTINSPADEIGTNGLLWNDGPVTVTGNPIRYSGGSGVTSMSITAHAGVNGPAVATLTDNTPGDGFEVTFPEANVPGPNDLAGVATGNLTISINTIQEDGNTGPTFGVAVPAVGTGVTVGANPFRYDNQIPQIINNLQAVLYRNGTTGWINEDWMFADWIGVSPTPIAGGAVANTADCAAGAPCVGIEDISFRAGTSLADLETVTSGDDLAETFGPNSYILEVTITDILGNTTVVYYNNTATGQANPNLATTTFGVDHGDPTLSLTAGSLGAMDIIDNEAVISPSTNTSIQVQFSDTRSGFPANPVFWRILRLAPGLNTEASQCLVGVITGSGACAPTNTVVTTSVYNYIGGPTAAGGATFGEGYYDVSIFIVDAAGNRTDLDDMLQLRDTQNPTPGGLAFDANLTAGTPETFTSQATDLLDLDDADFQLSWGAGLDWGANTWIQFETDDIGSFGLPFEQQAGVNVTMANFVGEAEFGLGGGQNITSMGRFLVGDHAQDVTTVETGSATAIAGAVTGTSGLSFGGGARPASGNITGSTFDANRDNLTDGATICGDFDNDGCAAGSFTSTTVTWTITGAGSNAAGGPLQTPFSQVRFYSDDGNANGNFDNFLANASLSITENATGTVRTYTYTATVPASAFLAAGTYDLIGLGINTSGSALVVQDPDNIVVTLD